MKLRPSKWLLSAFSAVTLLYSAAPTYACDCEPETTQEIVWPPSGSEVPRNTRLRLFLQLPQQVDSAVAAREYAAPVLLCAPLEDASVPAQLWAVELRRSALYKMALVELIPKQPLPPNADCGLVAANGQFLAWYRVAGQSDERPPDWRGMLEAAAWLKGYGQSACLDGSAFAKIRVEAPEDDATPVDQHLYAVWVAPQNGLVDYDRQPTVWIPATVDAQGRRVLVLDGGGSCRPGGSFPYPTLGQRPRVGVRAVDLAGRLSPPRELELEGVANDWQWRQLGYREPESYTLPIALVSPAAPADRPASPVRGFLIAAIAVVLVLGALLYWRRAGRAQPLA